MMAQISCTLTIHSHDEAAKLAHEIKVLTEETSSVTKKLTQIAENSAHSGEIIRVITIVSAIYLPGSFATVSAQTPRMPSIGLWSNFVFRPERPVSLWDELFRFCG